jgi:uncharacterized membrane protein
MVATSRTVEVLGAVGFGILGLVTVIYSLLFLVVQSSNTTLTPRLNIFQEDPWVWITFSGALGLFAYSMSAFLAIGGAEKVSVVVPIFAFVAALAIAVLIRNIQSKAFSALQVNATIDALQRSGRGVIDALYPEDTPRPAVDAGSTTPTAEAGRPVSWAAPQSTLQTIDRGRLLKVAETADAVVVIRVKVGETLWEGATVAEVHGNLSDEVVLGSFVIGVNRKFDQDPLLAFRLLSDIGLRALSPAVNDPATAAQSLDAIVGLLAALAARDLAVGVVKSSSDVTRINLEVPTWTDFLSEGVDELLVASRNSPMMLARARATLSGLAGQCPRDRRSDVEARLHLLTEAGYRRSEAN